VDSLEVGVPKAEAGIVAALPSFLQATFCTDSTRDVVMMGEFAVDNGVCDLCAFVVRPDLVQARTAAGLVDPFLRPSDAAVLAPLVRFRRLREGTLQRRSGLRRSTFRERLTELMDVGVITQVSQRGTLALDPSFHILFEKAIAVEAKVHDWRAALYQATRYATFAHSTYVALDSRFVHRAKAKLSTFRANRVGLIAVDSEPATCTVVLSQTRQRPTSAVAVVAANEKLFGHIRKTGGAYSSLS
jgi:hypothetical protein